MELDLNGYTDLPPGKIASVVTYLEMTEPPAAPACPRVNGLSLAVMDRADTNGYREIFRRVGERWLWFSRLQMADGELAALLRDPAIDFFVLEMGGRPGGLLELDRRSPGEVEIAFFGVIEEWIGTGAGSFLMARALDMAWSGPTRRVWLHTCTIDHYPAPSGSTANTASGPTNWPWKWPTTRVWTARSPRARLPTRPSLKVDG